MAATALSSGQRMLMDQLAQDGARVWRSPAGYRMVRPIGEWVTLTEQTVQALVSAGYLRQVEAYGRDRGLYEISDGGRSALSSTHA